MNLTAKQLNKFMEWQFWLTTAQFYANTCADSEAQQRLFHDAISRAGNLQASFEVMFCVGDQMEQEKD